jgi:hypothetical protein
MVKRKAAKKRKAKGEIKQGAGRKTKPAAGMPFPALLMKILAVILTVILVIALTLYVLGRMPARGFWVLAGILAIIAFVVMPAMRKKFIEGG